jgi:polyisoprenoid-binding protein YceI
LDIRINNDIPYALRISLDLTDRHFTFCSWNFTIQTVSGKVKFKELFVATVYVDVYLQPKDIMTGADTMVP